MKAPVIFAAVLACAVLAITGAAVAKPSPFKRQIAAPAGDDISINSGASGASLESDYFQAPRLPYAVGRVFPCRLQMRVFDKTRLASTCH